MLAVPQNNYRSSACRRFACDTPSRSVLTTMKRRCTGRFRSAAKILHSYEERFCSRRLKASFIKLITKMHASSTCAESLTDAFESDFRGNLTG
eukprot:2146263-Pleurochrysis_carterae.AAC.1